MLTMGKPLSFNAERSPAHPKGEHLSDIVQPYALRAPEIILGLGWGPVSTYGVSGAW